MKDLEQERDVLHQGLDLLDKCRSWYKEELLRIKEQQHQLISGKVSGRGRWRRIWGGGAEGGLMEELMRRKLCNLVLVVIFVTLQNAVDSIKLFFVFLSYLETNNHFFTNSKACNAPIIESLNQVKADSLSLVWKFARNLLHFSK